jgi:2-polyprenyl-3-methyl-5-hydroxy-6-metoxy-1,4-benzoquinol methylase
MNNYIINYIKKNKILTNKILVLGPGRSRILENILNINESIHIDLLDHNQEALDFQKILLTNYKNASIKYFKSEFSNENSISFLDKKYDLILCTEVLEHVTNNHFLLSKINSLLSDSGLLFVSVPNKNIDIFLLNVNKDYMQLDSNELGHLNFYNKIEFKNLLINNGFHILKIKGIASEYVFFHFILAFFKVKIDEDTGQILEPGRSSVKLGKFIFNILKISYINRFLNHIIPRNYISITCRQN